MLAFISGYLREYKGGLIKGTKGCSYECRSMLLGALIICMDKQSWLSTVAPFEGVCVLDAAQGVREMKLPSQGCCSCSRMMETDIRGMADNSIMITSMFKLEDYSLPVRKA